MMTTLKAAFAELRRGLGRPENIPYLILGLLAVVSLAARVILILR